MAAESIVMCFMTVPAEARQGALEALGEEGAIAGFPGSTASAAASFVESEGTLLEDRQLILVSAQAGDRPTSVLAEDFWRAIESTLERAGVSTVEHMIAYAVPGTA
jgi:hypothetical protein